jgi:serine/threonine-protein kinase
MDYLDGKPFHHVLRRGDAGFSLGMSLRVLCEVLQGLEYAHSLADYDGTPINIVHRDVTPQNIFVTFDGQIKLVDFGIATSNDSKIETTAGTLKGKPAYMPPEQVLGKVDRRSDIFAAGVVLFEAVAGRRVWGTRNDLEILATLLKGEIPQLSEAMPDAPAELVRICSKAMANDPADRYQTAAGMQADLEAFAASAGHRASAREVGLQVSSMFEAERQQTRAAIETHVAAARAGGAAELPRLQGSVRGEKTAGGPGSVSRVRTGAAASTGSLAVQIADGEPSEQPPRPLPRKAALAAIGAAALLALGSGVIRRPESPPEPPHTGSFAGRAPPGLTVPSATPASATPQDAGATAPDASAAPAASGPEAGHGGPLTAQRPFHPGQVKVVNRPSCDPPFYFQGTRKVFKPSCL